MVKPSPRPPGQAGGVTTTKSLLTWTLLLLSATAARAKVDPYVLPQQATTAEIVASATSRRSPETAGSSPAEIGFVNDDVHTARFKQTDHKRTNNLRNYQDAPAPALHTSAVGAPLVQSVESSGLTAIPDARLLQDWEADDIVLLSTIDGSLHARDRKTGQHRWTLDMPEEPMIQTIHQEHEYIFIVEPTKEGQLYAQYMDPEVGLVRLDATVKKMATGGTYSFLIHGQRLATTSEQQSKLYTLDAVTGEILSEFPKYRSSGRADSQPRCIRRNELELEDPACKPGRSIRLGRQVYIFTISNELTGQDLCTIKFSEWVTNQNDVDLQQQYVQSLDGTDILGTHGGRLIGLDVYDAPRLQQYTHIVSSPIAGVFDVIRSRDDDDGSTDLVLLSRPMDLPLPQPEIHGWKQELKNTQRIFVNRTELGDWYAMSDFSYPGFTGNASFAKIRSNPTGAHLNMTGGLEDIVGVHILNQGAKFAIRNTISSTAANADSDTIDAGKQVTSQEPAQPPALLSTNVDTKSWGSGFVGLILGGIIVLLLNSKLNYTGRKSAQAILVPTTTNIVTPVIELSATDVSEKQENTRGKQDLLSNSDPMAITVEETKPDRPLTPSHSRVQSATSVGSPRKKTVKIGDQDDANSTDAESDDDEGSNEAGAEDHGDQNTSESLEAQPRRPRTKRGKRGGRKNKKKKSMDPSVFDEKPTIIAEQYLDNGMVQIGRLKIDVSEEKCLGRGSNGTAVYPGILDGREVAVKRLIKSANNLAEKEIKHLVSSDENSHVVRYFGKEESRDFFYIALDQFTTSLDQFIEHPEKFPSLVDETQGFDIKDCLRQITDGVQHLHSLKLVHRDIKPQNVLVRAVKSNRPVTGMPKLQFVISDFGLCKPLEDGVMSTFAPTANHTAAGTTGWRAPELLVNPRDMVAAPTAESSHSKTTSTTHSLDGTAIDLPTGRRATKAIDIFSLGCVFYYVMTRGGHPFDVGGSSLGRDLNIKENNFTTELMRFHKYEYDAEDLIMQMVNHEPKNRPDTFGVLKHPYFWTTEQKLEFVCLVSDCYEREKNSITDIHAKGPVVRTPAEEISLAELASLESLAPNVIGVNSKKELRDFLQALPRTFLHGMGKQRSYTGTRMIDLLRLIRNKKNHFRDLPDDVQALILARGTSLEEGYYGFWADRFPALLINCHANISDRQLVERFRLERWYE